jgi:hypothetical protein
MNKPSSNPLTRQITIPKIADVTYSPIWRLAMPAKKTVKKPAAKKKVVAKKVVAKKAVAKKPAAKKKVKR